MYGENPFFDVEETIEGQIKPPFEVGAECTDVLSRILDSDPGSRARIDEILVHPFVTMDVSKYLKTVLEEDNYAATVIGLG